MAIMRLMRNAAPYIDAWRRRWAREAAEDLHAQEEALGTVQDLVFVLVRRYGVRRVILTGSLARGEFRSDSDIDLLVEGLPVDALFRAGADLERIAGRGVDLVPVESVSAVYREIVEREGRVIYDGGG